MNPCRICATEPHGCENRRHHARPLPCLSEAEAERDRLRPLADALAEALHLGRELTEQDNLQGCAGWDAFHNARLDASTAYHASKEQQR